MSRESWQITLGLADLAALAVLVALLGLAVLRLRRGHPWPAALLPDPARYFRAVHALRDTAKELLDAALHLRPIRHMGRYAPLGLAFGGLVLFAFALAYVAALVTLFAAMFGPTDASPFAGFRTGAVIVALLGAPFLIWRSYVGQRTADIAEQSHITEQINTAVQNLGAVREVNRIGRTVTYTFTYGAPVSALEWQGSPLDEPEGASDTLQTKWENFSRTEPNLEVRIGAIYALERIARTSLDDHIQIMEILTAYIRENAKASEAPSADLPECPEYDEAAPERWAEALKAWRNEHWKEISRLYFDAPVRADLLTSLTVLARRNAEQIRTERLGRPVSQELASAAQDWHPHFTIDLSRVRLRPFILSGGNFDYAQLIGVDLRGAALPSICLKHALLAGVRLEQADLTKAKCAHAKLERTHLQGAALLEAEFPQARMDAVHLVGARNTATASFHGVGISRSDLRESGVTLEQIYSMFGDASVTLPGGATPGHKDWPSHWPEVTLERDDFHKQWRAWLGTLAKAPPTPDDPA